MLVLRRFGAERLVAVGDPHQLPPQLQARLTGGTTQVLFSDLYSMRPDHSVLCMQSVLIV